LSESSKKHKAVAPSQLNFVIFVCSTSRYQQQKDGVKIEDVSGYLIESLVKASGHKVLFKKIIPDDKTQIQNAVDPDAIPTLPTAVPPPAGTENPEPQLPGN